MACVLSVKKLSTYKLSHEERDDPECDVLTGCHVLDSKWRMLIVEGVQHGAMGIVSCPFGMRPCLAPFRFDDCNPSQLL